MRTSLLGSIVCIVALAVVAVAPRTSRAATCDTLSNPLYLQVGDTQLNLMRNLGRMLRDNTPEPITLVFTTSGSCTNIDNFYNHTAPITVDMQYVPSTAEDPAWDPALSPTLTCTPPGAGVFPDIGNSALFISSCTSQPPPATVALENGPIQAYVMAVPKASSQIAITFEEAYFVFGFGMAGMVMPWIDETQMFIRTITKSTLLTWAANIDVPGADWYGIRFDGSPSVVSALQNSTEPEAAIGILGAEVYDAGRSTLTELAYRAKDQYAAYFADSTSTSFDKQNVRDGHYTVWSPTVWMYNTTGSGGTPVNPAAKYVVDMIAGHPVTPTPTIDPDVAVARVGLVPDCAMRVQRQYDGGDLSLYQPATSCVCKFLSIVATTTCATCDVSTPCTTGVCRSGYCEDF
ncbi:MAG TPA: hypothetical protein VMJ10_29705 [Kofleriaceae bacterium]|nr:hypothetical protein [Kofleriaceae bacterium]